MQLASFNAVSDCLLLWEYANRAGRDIQPAEHAIRVESKEVERA